MKKKKIHGNMVRQELLQLQESKKAAQEYEDYMDREEEKAVENWVTRKENQNQMKEAIMAKAFNDHLEIRENIGKHLYQLRVEEDNKIHDLQEKQERDVNRKAEKLADKQKAMQKENMKDLRLFYTNYLKQKKEKQRIERQQGIDIQNHYKTLKKEMDHQTEISRIAQKKQEESIQAYNLKLKNEKEKERLHTRNQNILNAMDVTHQMEEDSLELVTYMKKVSLEPWAEKNDRLQQFVKKQCQAHGRLGTKQGANTHGRLGFAGHTYTKSDLVGSNEIAKGDMLGALLHGQQIQLKTKN
ncbi:hypothetical protein HDV02_005448 [Globomyces sp. JEL0801]|nr:hypothetical protein HDV02_005448 [Globomyces sp. JEL0801]